MVTAFFKILNMSLTASVLIAVVVLLRLFLRKAPKWISCLLWAAVAVRLLCPFSVESVLSLIPSAEPVPPSIVTQERPEIHTGIMAVNKMVNPVISESFAPSPGDSANPLQIYSFAAAACWIVGMVILLFYALVSYLLLHRKVRAFLPWKGSVRICDDIQTPFILGVIRPRIYIPSGLDAVQMDHIIAHENAHLKRLDHFWKPLGYLTLTVHWFNPLVWAAYVLLCRDIELACDEKVIRKMAKEESLSYSSSLLSCSVSRRNILICPLAFGEVGVKERVSHVLHYKKPAVWVGAAAVFICAVVTICFLTDPKRSENDGETTTKELSENSKLVLSETGEVLSLTTHPEPVTKDGASKQDTDDAREKTAELQEEIERAKKELEEKGLLESGPDWDKKAKTLDGAIGRAILMDGAAHAPSLEYTPHRAASFIKLGEETSEKDGAELITVYGMAMYMEADWNRKNSRPGICETSCYHMPVAIVVSMQDGIYQWQEYWTPQDGSYYGGSIREKFPEDIADLAMDTQPFVYANTMNCYAQLLKEDVGDIFSVIGRNLDMICVADTGSNPQDYIDHAMANYRELIYYGEETLAYRDKFRNDFDGLRAEILDRACADIEEIMASGYYQKTENSTSEYENLDVDYVEDHGQYIVEGDMVFQYKKVLKGRDPNAVKSLVFVVLTNDQDVTWEQVFKSIFSSDSRDFLPGTLIIGIEAVDD